MLDGALAAQQLLYISAEYSLPLLPLKLDISAAFDSLEHPAIARYFTACQPSQEAHILLKYIVLSTLTLRLGQTSWGQRLYKGLLQGTPFSLLSSLDVF